MIEKDYERLCRNAAYAFKLPNLAFYETSEWLELSYGHYCIALCYKKMKIKNKFEHMIKNAIDRLSNIKKNNSYFLDKDLQNCSFNCEEALIRLDLNIGISHIEFHACV